MLRLIFTLVLSAHLLLPIAASAQAAVGKSPLDYSLKQYGLILGVALLGGVVSWYSKVRQGEIPLWSISHLIGELVTSAFAGLMCFWICESAGLPLLITSALAGMAGHMGAKAITMLESWAAKRFGRVAP